MKLFGVYIPEQDASWEREGDIFDGIYERHGHCDADQCTCPDGRRFDEDYTIWEIVSLGPSIEDVGNFLRFLVPTPYLSAVFYYYPSANLAYF